MASSAVASLAESNCHSRYRDELEGTGDVVEESRSVGADGTGDMPDAAFEALWKSAIRTAVLLVQYLLEPGGICANMGPPCCM